MGCQQTGYQIRELQVEQSVGRYVDGNTDIETGLSPIAVLLHGMVQHPHGQRLDQAGALCQRNKLVGAHQVVLRVLPANQRLYIGELCRLDVDLGLVVQYQLIGFDGVAQLSHESQPVGAVLVVLGIVDDKTRFLLLCHVHSDVRPLQQSVGIRTMLGEHRDADAGLYVELKAF